ncbi:MAG: hypothetical protein ACFE0P_06800 [Oceanicaulis sp.]
MKQTLLLIAVLGGLVVAAAWVAFDTWTSIDAQMSWHGWLALGLGVVLTAAVGAGLMWLLFYSARSGHDDIDDRF